MAYFSPCWFVPRNLDPKLCRASLLQEAEEWVKTEQFSLHGGLSAVQNFQGVDEGMAVSRDDRQASIGKGAKSGSNPISGSHAPKKSGESTKAIDQALTAHPIMKDMRFNPSFPLVVDMKRMLLQFERCFGNELRDSPMIGIDPHYAKLIDNPVWPSRGKGCR